MFNSNYPCFTQKFFKKFNIKIKKFCESEKNLYSIEIIFNNYNIQRGIWQIMSIYRVNLRVYIIYFSQTSK